ncbi:MAG TPA: urate hydroxylase PuuD [Polyangia bacterium]|nr:urate hydroxylase PuuD [Polyangia bacterium]
MDPNVREWLELVFRWAHVVAGITWIGHLYFFNWVNAQVAKTYDADSKKKVVPELMPRALYFFRWGAAYTWVTGVLLLGIVYSMTDGVLVAPMSTLDKWAGSGIVLAVWVVGFFIYDVLWKAMAKQEKVGVIVSFVIVTGIAFGMSRLFTPRAVFIIIGGLFGTIMFANVWMRIWPNQRKIIAATKAGTAPDAALVGLAGLRSKQNTYMSVPLVLMMVGSHFPTVEATSAGGENLGWAVLAGLILLGWGVTKLLFKKSATPTPAKYEPAASEPPKAAA